MACALHPCSHTSLHILADGTQDCDTWRGDGMSSTVGPHKEASPQPPGGVSVTIILTPLMEQRNFTVTVSSEAPWLIHDTGHHMPAVRLGLIHPPCHSFISHVTFALVS